MASSGTIGELLQRLSVAAGNQQAQVEEDVALLLSSTQKGVIRFNKFTSFPCFFFAVVVVFDHLAELKAAAIRLGAYETLLFILHQFHHVCGILSLSIVSAFWAYKEHLTIFLSIWK